MSESDETLVERRNYYVGETANQLRDGYGVYFYANKFFRYEGDWLKGKKHGHGKLLMADGSYYEGEFKQGEIEGHGFRKWQHNGNSYSGEFSNGEMHGHGVMNYADGSQFQGEFYRNQRHGNGILRDRDMNEYEGSWYKNKKHGQGIQTYANGDEYEGGWIEGNRHGEGDMNCVDGTIYEGQWRADMYNGQGTMVHASGFTYEGLWVNGEPAVQASEVTVVLPPGQKHIEIPQGKRFSLNLQLIDSNREPVSGEHGREFQITAGYRYAQSPRSAHGQSLLELIEDIEARPIPTPFGYDVLPYPVVESLKDYEESKEVQTKKKQRQSPVATRVFGGEIIHESKEILSDGNKTDEMLQGENPDEAEASSTSGSKYATSETQIEIPADAAEEESEISSTRLLPPPAPQRSSAEGLIEFPDLLLPPAPPNYRPFLQDGDDGKVHSSSPGTPSGSSSSLRRGPGAASVSSSSVRSDKSKRSKGSRTASATSTSSTSINDGKGGKGKSRPVDGDEKGAKMGKKSPRKKSRESKPGKGGKSPNKREPSALRKGVPVVEEQDDFLDMMNSTFAKEGDYVLIVQEVTHPLFLEKRLPPVFVLVKVTAPKKPVKKATGKKTN